MCRVNWIKRHRVMRDITTILTIGATALALASPARCQDSRRWSSDHRWYALSAPGQRVGNGQERERLVVYTSADVQVAVAHVWLVEPDGTMRVGIRGCEDWGWIGATRLFCEGTINPSTGIYLVFDAKSGRELRELAGSNFVWSPDQSKIANFGNVPHFSAVENKSDSLEIEGKLVYPSVESAEQHWFRSEPVWSADSRRVALVDHRRKQNAVYLAVAAVTGNNSAYKLPWQVPLEDWPPDLDFSVRWEGKRVVVRHAGMTQIVTVD